MASEKWNIDSYGSYNDELVELSPEKSQQFCNFVVLYPSWLPNDCKIRRMTFRPEQPPKREAETRAAHRPNWTIANTSSYLLRITGHNREARLKMFLYDIAPPAVDHPSLWSHQDTPFQLDDRHIGWVGTNYKQKSAASVILNGTMCELSVEAGNFSEEEIRTLMSNLKVADDNATRLILRTPYAQLNYWARYKAPIVNVPISMWNCPRPPPLTSYQWSSTPESIQELPYKTVPPPPQAGSSKLEGACIYGERHQPLSVETIYSLNEDRDSYWWSIAMPSTMFGQQDINPQPSAHPAKHKKRTCKTGFDWWHGWISDKWGPHDAFFVIDDIYHLVLTNSNSRGTVMRFVDWIG